MQITIYDIDGMERYKYNNVLKILFLDYCFCLVHSDDTESWYPNKLFTMVIEEVL